MAGSVLAGGAGVGDDADVLGLDAEGDDFAGVSVPLPDGQAAIEFQFRHDKIRDFYSHFALLGDAAAEERFALARDDQFAGVYDYLARELPPAEVNTLKEYLLSAAIDDNDHRLSDRFLQHLRWRSLLVREDPLWLDEHDLPSARAALTAWNVLKEEREVLESQMQEVRETIVEARAIARILCADTDERLEAAAVAALSSLGAKVQDQAPAPGVRFVTYGARTFALICVAGDRHQSSGGRIGIGSRLRSVPGPKMLVYNPKPLQPPDERDWREAELRFSELSSAACTTWEHAAAAVLPLSSFGLLQHVRQALERGSSAAFWNAFIADLDRAPTEPPAESRIVPDPRR